MDLSFLSKTFYFEHECQKNEVVVLKEQVTRLFLNVEHLEKQIKPFQLFQKEGMFISFVVFCNKTLEYFHVLGWKLDCQKKSLVLVLIFFIILIYGTCGMIFRLLLWIFITF
jgi:hypothetical protein